jgi:hypothetical protein
MLALAASTLLPKAAGACGIRVHAHVVQLAASQGGVEHVACCAGARQ